MVLKLYMYESSLPARSILMTGAALGIQFEKKFVDMEKGEHRSPEFLKINPQHCVPTLVDGDFVLWESHCITPYLADKYGKDDWLYPKNLQKRGTINQILHFNNSTIYPVLRRVFETMAEQKSKNLPEALVEELLGVYKLLNTFLERTRYIADDHVTVADFSTIVSITAGDYLVPIDSAKFPKLFAWMERMKGLPCYQANVPGFEEFKNMISARLRT